MRLVAITPKPAYTPQTPPWCDTHGGRILEDTSINGVAATVLLIEVWRDHPTVQDALRSSIDPERALPYFQERHSPLCCFLGDDYVEAIYKQARMREASGLTGDERAAYDMVDFIRRKNAGEF